MYSEPEIQFNNERENLIQEEEELLKDYDAFGDNDCIDQLNNYIDEPNAKAFLTLSDGKFQHKSNAINSILYKTTKLRTTDRLRRVQKNLSDAWLENSDIFSLENRESTIKLTDIIITLASF